MRFYCVIEKCNLDEVKDFQSFRDALPIDISFYTESEKDKAINMAKRIAIRAIKSESFIVTVDLNKLLNKRFLAQTTGPSILATIMPEHKVDNWKISRVSKNEKNEWNIEKVKAMFDFPKIKGNRIHQRLPLSIAGSIMLGVAYFSGLSFWPMVGLVVLGGVITTLINRSFEHYINRHYKTVQQIKDVQNPAEKEALRIGKDSTSVLQSLGAFVKPVTWLHPLAYAAGKLHANNHNEKMIKAIESLHRPRA